MKIGIIGAMQSEIALLKEKMEQLQTVRLAGTEYYTGRLMGKPVVLACSGIGKVNAALCAQTMILRFEVDALINSGVAGCVCDDLTVYDVVLSQDLVYHDFDNELLVKYFPHTDRFPGDPELLSLAQRAYAALEEPGYRLKAGRVATGDQFIESKEVKDSIVARLHPDCVEMEGAAIAHAAYISGLPVLVIRSMSDNADGNADVSFHTFETVCANHSARLLLKMLELA
ncbi:MAG: 5'-methylthioadenosine/adenosylhomocysteine nucleosidase [Oscillospiraceae bacterium]|nr:5'-methylthioadenosine/adenosylhomocysteine nucleosidase [Oscillospiraceae bacterium]